MHRSFTTKPRFSGGTARERGIAIMVSCILLVLAIPMVGLTIDGTLLYIVKSRLQGAVDGAALAATQGLARGTNDTAQVTAAQNAGATYVMLNYPASFFFTSNVTVDPTTDVTVDESVSHQVTVSVTAHVTVPTLFMRWLSFTSTNVNATASVVRRDVNIAIVMDRSGSLQSSGSCQPLIQSAINFVNKFSNGRDEMALITFASSTHVDFPIANNFETATPSVPTMIGNLVCAGSTSTAQALWQGYDELVGLNQAGALNVILLFTDGKPTGVNVNMPLVNGTTCTSPHSGTPKWINGVYNTYTNVNEFFGILAPTNTGLGNITNSDLNPTPDSNTGAGCQYMSSWSSSDTTTSDFLGVPTTDIFGDNLNSGYQSITPLVNGGYIDLSQANNALAMTMNGADDAASQIRSGTSVCANSPATALTECQALLTHSGNMSGIIIYAIGLLNATYGAPNPDLLQRIANDPAASNYNSGEAAGEYVPANTAADINAAFAEVASQITRLAK